MNDLSAGGDHILDNQQIPSFDVATLGKLACAVILWRLAHEQGGQPGQLGQHGDERDTTEFQACEPRRSRWNQG